MTTMRTRLLGLMMATGLAATCAQAQPEALDRVPADTPIVVGIQSIAGLAGDVQQWMGVFAPEEAAMGVMIAQQLTQLPGLNPEGSAAVALTFPQGTMDAEPNPVIVVPVNDLGQFAQALGGVDAGDGLTQMEMNGMPMFAKSIGGGFAAMSPVRGLIESFEGGTGNNAAHRDRLGARGTAAAGDADIFAVIDLASMRPMLNEGLAEMEQQMEFAAMMAGEAAAAQMAMMANAAKAVVEDGRTAFIGLGADESGMWVDFAGQFQDGSETSEVFTGAGNSTPMLGALPNMDFIFATAFDTSDPGLRGLIKNMASMGQGMGFGAMGSPELVDLNDGGSMIIGVTPGLFAGGLFANTVQFTATSDPEALHDAMRETSLAMNGTSQEGVLFNTMWEENATEIAGRSVDAWGFSMQGDPDHPNGAQAGMMLQQMTMLFGGKAGPSGYVATTDKGIYSTYSKNSKLMERVLNNAGGSLGDNDSLGAVAAHLPEGRTAEAYLNVKGVLDMVMPMLGMFGVDADFGELPETMQPIGMGLASGEGGMHARMFVPADILHFAGKLSQEMNSGAGDWEDDDDSSPQF